MDNLLILFVFLRELLYFRKNMIKFARLNYSEYNDCFFLKLCMRRNNLYHIITWFHNHLLIISLLVCAFVGTEIQAAKLYNTSPIHYFRTDLGVGFDCDLQYQKGQPGIEDLLSSKGVKTGLTLGYRLKYQHFIFDVGVGANYGYKVNDVADRFDAYERKDSDGDTFLGEDAWRERGFYYNNIALTVPLLFGGEWNRFYFLLGAKLDFNLQTNVKEKGLYTLIGWYDYYLDPFENMPNHGFVTDEPYQTPTLKMPNTYQVAACLEFGYRLTGSQTVYAVMTRQPAVDVYLGAFVEYGVLHNTVFTPLTVGVKATMTVEVKPKLGCVMCKEL